MASHPLFNSERCRAAAANLATIYGQLKQAAQQRCEHAHDSLQEFLAVAYTTAVEMEAAAEPEAAESKPEHAAKHAKVKAVK